MTDSCIRSLLLAPDSVADGKDVMMWKRRTTKDEGRRGIKKNYNLE
jgi:hypothetical protein